jgi:hypothetical protein
MGHLFVPAALVLWVVVAVVRTFSAPAQPPAEEVEVEVELAQPRAQQPAVQGEG